MTNAKYSTLHCSHCGRYMGKQKGIQVVLGLVCDDPICNYQNEITANEQRDSYIVAGVLEGVPVSQIAREAGMSRQRIYQIMDTWKAGV